MRITEVLANGKAESRVLTTGRVGLRVPIVIKRHSAHKQIIAPSAADVPLRKLTPYQRALARGHRWLAMLESCQAPSMKELAAQEKVDPSLISRLVNLTTLAPDIVEAILDDTLPRQVTLLDLGIDLPLEWDAQRSAHQRKG